MDKQTRFNFKKKQQLPLLFTVLLFTLTIFTTKLHAQVTIGSGKPPITGCLLDLKEYDLTDAGSDNGTSSTKGFNLPRVRLVDLDKLLPMFDNLKDPIPIVAEVQTILKQWRIVNIPA